MAKLVFLGTASAVAFEGHDNTYMVVQGQNSSVLIDCAAKPLLRLKKAGIQFADLSDLIITHFHADHVSGLPNLLMDMWILGRQAEFSIHGSQHSISRVEKMMALFDWDTWTNMYPVSFHTIPLEESSRILDNSDFTIHSSPVDHLIPTLGLRIENLESGFVAAYSCDTNPVDRMVTLAAGADVLIHEAAGPFQGHSTSAQAGEIASQAQVAKLYLIHYSMHGGKTAASIISGAEKTFPGKVVLAEDLMEIEFTK